MASFSAVGSMRLKTRRPMARSPANFFVIRIGSQFNFSERYVRSVVPSSAGSVPSLKFAMIFAT